ncbi:MAG: prepilin-type N-terminal cleavage/methylation domain-containing protein [bacterium]|nr:prepilin-type N-terminal cleavage/methylation domain-containing protein [bacterium]
MKRSHPGAGFTLVELSIVVVIAGLLLSAILGFSRLRINAKLTATIATVQSTGAATAMFMDRYGSLPGDLRDAASKIPGCGASVGTCEAPTSASTTGDGNVGEVGAISRHQTTGQTPAEHETVLFWSHLLQTSLITRTTDTYTSSNSPMIAWGASHPAAPIGGGFHVKDADGGMTTPLPGWPPAAKQPEGTFLVLQTKISRDLVPAQPGDQPIRASEASWIDRKVDDGNPFRGSVLGYGTVTLPMAGSGCFTWTAVDRGAYDQHETSKDCGLTFRIAP